MESGYSNLSFYGERLLRFVYLSSSAIFNRIASLNIVGLYPVISSIFLNRYVNV
jgi:hypothetical protein